METNLTNIFLESLLEIKAADLDLHIWKKAKECLIDYLCVTFAGAKALKANRSDISDVCREQGDAPVIGFHGKSSPYHAALLNGISAHMLELDDGHRFGMMHPGAVVISALLAVAERENMSGKDFLFGVILGYEAAIRLASAIQPKHKTNGFHATATCGTVGAALGISGALGFSKKQVKTACAAALTSASGLLELIDDNSELKPYNAGKAAMNGIAAASMGRLAFESPEDPLGGKRGFFNVITPLQNKSYLIGANQSNLCIETIYVKPYAACRHCHSPIEAALKMGRHFATHDLAHIAHIYVDTYEAAVFGHDHTRVNSISAAKMSIPYCVAVALLYGDGGMDMFTDEILSRNEVTQLTDKIIVTEDKALTELSPRQRAARVRIVFGDGRKQECLVKYPKGEPENPISEESLLEKYDALMRFAGKSEAASQQILYAASHLEHSMDTLMELL